MSAINNDICRRCNGGFERSHRDAIVRMAAVANLVLCFKHCASVRTRKKHLTKNKKKPKIKKSKNQKIKRTHTHRAAAAAAAAAAVAAVLRPALPIRLALTL